MATQQQLQAIESKLAEIRGKAAKIGKGVEVLATEKGRPGVAAAAAGTTTRILGGGAVTPPSATYLPSVPQEFFLPEIPGEPPDLTQAKSRLDYYTKQLEYQQQEAQKLRQEWQAKQTVYEKERESWWQKLLAKPTTEERAGELWEEIGIKPKEYFEERAADIAEVESLYGEYDKMVASKDRALLTEESRLAPMEFIQKRMTSTEREWNIRLNQMSAQMKTKLAIMEMKEGNFTQARSFIREAISDYTFDLRLAYEQFSEFRDINEDALAELDREYQTALDKAENAALNAWQMEEDKVTQIGNLMLQYPLASINFSDTLEQALEKAREVAATAPAGWTEFTDTEKRKLAAAGIDWTTPEGYQRALQHLYGAGVSGKDAQRMYVINDLMKKMYKSVETPTGGYSMPKALGEFTATEYQRLLREWIGMDGTKGDFLTAYPPESLLSADEVTKLPPSVYRPGMTIFGFAPSGAGGEFTEEDAANIANSVACDMGGGTWNPNTNTCER